MPSNHIIKDIIHNIGENQNREGLIDTPKRAAKAMQFLTQGYEWIQLKF